MIVHDFAGHAGEVREDHQAGHLIENSYAEARLVVETGHGKGNDCYWPRPSGPDMALDSLRKIC